MIYLAIALTLLAAIGIWIVYVYDRKAKRLDNAEHITIEQLKEWLLKRELDDN